MNGLMCVVCGKPLNGGIDTFGEITTPMCESDWYAIEFRERKRIDEERASVEGKIAVLQGEIAAYEYRLQEREPGEVEREVLQGDVEYNQDVIADLRKKLGQ